jgi:hypothetical protein
VQTPFGHTLNFTLSLSRPPFHLGPGWAVLAGALSTGLNEVTLTGLLPLFSLWLLVDPILGTLWELNVQQGLWRQIRSAHLPPPPAAGFFLPYAQPGSMAGRFVLTWRRYRLWWRETYGPAHSSDLAAFGLGITLALLIALFLGAAIFWLTLVSISLILLAGRHQPDLTAADGGRLQAMGQWLMPWLMGSLLWSSLTPLSLALAICYSAIYLGGLRLGGHHLHADTLLFFGQVAALVLLLSQRLLPGGALVTVMLLAQWLIRSRRRTPEDFLPRAQPYLVVSALVAGLSAGSLAW